MLKYKPNLLGVAHLKRFELGIESGDLVAIPALEGLQLCDFAL
jgi:hypothetical protein